MLDTRVVERERLVHPVNKVVAAKIVSIDACGVHVDGRHGGKE